MSVQIVRFSTSPEHVPEVEEAIDQLFTAVKEAAPAGLEYTAARVGDSPEFLLTLQLPDDAPNPLLGIEAAGEFRARIAGWAGVPVPPQTLDVLGRYAG
ncbi:hypothetical protein ABZ863_17850 [Saccharomonospora sp. NPDC046836]|uniref:hypothetical protein n=1 Tax=Saccharomonospora sp. NPDC046836 TaxID=3156921 RepID=UPI0033CCC684